MAEVLSPFGGTMFKTPVENNGKTYEVSTVNTMDAGWETLVFLEGYTARTGFERRHANYAEAKAWHEKVEREFPRA